MHQTVFLLQTLIKALASARGSEKKKKKKKPNREKFKRSCQCLYMFLTTQIKKPNLRRRLNHVPINQIVYNFYFSFIYDILEGCKNIKEIQ